MNWRELMEQGEQTRYQVAVAKGAGITQAEAARQIGISRERVRQLAYELFGGWPCLTCRKITRGSYNGVCADCRRRASSVSLRVCADCGGIIPWGYARRCATCNPVYLRERNRKNTLRGYQSLCSRTPAIRQGAWSESEDAELLAATGPGALLAVAQKLGRHYGACCNRKAHLKHPGRRRAHSVVYAAVKRGELIRPDECSRCHKKSRRIGAHHADYSRPLDVEWLCSLCHKAVDRVLEKVEAGGSVQYKNSTHCVRGHEWSPETSGWQGPGKTKRYCKLCVRIRAKQRYERLKVAA